MTLHSRILIVLFSIRAIYPVYSQTYNQPNTGIKSHETLEISKIEAGSQETKISLTIENRIEGGNFCADKNISIVYPDGSAIKLLKAEGIPRCPETHKFKSIGEKLVFTLTFPPIKEGTEWIDLVEECTSNCFYIYGITLDQELNKRLDDAFIISSKGDPEKNLQLFRSILESVDDKNPGIEGTLYINVITSAIESGDKVEAAVWYKRLLSSSAPRMSLYVKYLNDRRIKY